MKTDAGLTDDWYEQLGRELCVVSFGVLPDKDLTTETRIIQALLRLLDKERLINPGALADARAILRKCLEDADRVVSVAEFSASKSGNKMAEHALPPLRDRADLLRSALRTLGG